ncbi:DNA-binding response OmpR family regulator [Clostridium acetobutylicum]|uniref:Stage 0 sporulation protein A homolog n=1 Tax=Clostridium acetobutylicum (strain ATCC 824 / DSM 792 / JCM 1419 / IAM 19013 / LMG 5710 / NBRC 13948 / NRRL B-527 / VKM B-1787 / 2291 / W) TaxID=272562 RepID=Q97KT6_CLOAB|nr:MULTISPECIES: response regulator transcription factor [Clostridium]AAK78806.1 Response regulator [Clostridium acetobutylicum ATCC 824]ADZ19880.1 Response regulator [Clostridium acetobutylicum EA 2018]AEI34310.1 response regulator [Clostridium acetobutylicum DSM 1731]AWV80524.1 DNA-binding response regulator [Clostridium acetobutylicum]MBC2392714.1 response regulator transcription factor [Clostridium acetobutylicum]
MLKILVVDDDIEILNLVSIYLSNEGYEIIKATNGCEAISKINNEKPKLVILDVMLPDIDGIEVCRKIREKLNVPIIILSAKVQNSDKIKGLLTGADDYITKPFNQLEFIVRVKTLLRRTYLFDTRGNKDDLDDIVLGTLTIKKSTHTVLINNNEIILTATEFEILKLLAINKGRIFSAEEIFETVWKEKYFQSNNTVMVHISNLRDKIERKLNGEKLIHTVWGVGYKIE